MPPSMTPLRPNIWYIPASPMSMAVASSPTRTAARRTGTPPGSRASRARATRTRAAAPRPRVRVPRFGREDREHGAVGIGEHRETADGRNIGRPAPAARAPEIDGLLHRLDRRSASRCRPSQCGGLTRVGWQLHHAPERRPVARPHRVGSAPATAASPSPSRANRTPAQPPGPSSSNRTRQIVPRGFASAHASAPPFRLPIIDLRGCVYRGVG